MGFKILVPHEAKCMQCPRKVMVFGSQSYVVCDKCLRKQSRKKR